MVKPVRISLIAYFHSDVLGFHAFRLFERMIEFSRSGLFVRRAFRLGGSVFRRRVFFCQSNSRGRSRQKNGNRRRNEFFSQHSHKNHFLYSRRRRSVSFVIV